MDFTKPMPQILANLSSNQLLIVYLSACVIGLNKSGFRGMDMLNVMLMALVFGSRLSTGIVLPLLCAGDMLAAFYYKRHVHWGLFWKLIFWMALGILLGVFWGQYWPEALFKKVFAAIIILSIILLVWQEGGGLKKIPHHPVFSPVMGLITGFATMMGNLAGAFATVYFSTQKINKNDFIGTVSMVFLVINLFKVPFQVIYWKNITPDSLMANLYLLPAVVLGFTLGFFLIRRINEGSYKKIIFALTFLGALSLLFT